MESLNNKKSDPSDVALSHMPNLLFRAGMGLNVMDTNLKCSFLTYKIAIWEWGIDLLILHLLLLVVYSLHIGCVKGIEYAPPNHTISVDNLGRHCYSDLKGLYLPSCKHESIFTNGSALQAALYMSWSLAHDGETPLTLKSFFRTSFQLFGGLLTVPPPFTLGSFLD